MALPSMPVDEFEDGDPLSEAVPALGIVDEVAPQVPVTVNGDLETERSDEERPTQETESSDN